MEKKTPNAAGEKDIVIYLSVEQKNQFSDAIQIGVLKELHKREFITDEQLKSLLESKNKRINIYSGT